MVELMNFDKLTPGTDIYVKFDSKQPGDFSFLLFQTKRNK